MNYQYQQQSGAYPQSPYSAQYPFPPHQPPAQTPNVLYPDPNMSNVAMMYGSALAGHGKQFVDQKDWAIQFDSNNQVIIPQYDINAPDLYIPLMAFITFILASGWLFRRCRFNPEGLGILAISCFIWLALEVILFNCLAYLFNVGSKLRFLDSVAFFSYKYSCMVYATIAAFFSYKVYLVTTLYFGASIAYFLLQTLKVYILPDVGLSTVRDPYDHRAYAQPSYQSSNRTPDPRPLFRRPYYLILAFAMLQSLTIYLLTRGMLI